MAEITDVLLNKGGWWGLVVVALLGVIAVLWKRLDRYTEKREETSGR